MAAAPRIDPKTVFTPAEWADLTARSRWKGLALVACCWGLIFAAISLCVLWPNPAVILLAIMVIGARQLGLAILMHDAAHGALHPDPNVNDFVGEWLCAAPVGASLARYRPYHLKHHKYTEQPEDPDLELSRPFPVTPASLRRKIIRDLTGQTFVKQRIAPALQVWFRGKQGVVIGEAGLRFWIANAIVFAVLAVLTPWWTYPLLWLVPMATWFPLVTRLRNIAEHACICAPDDPFRHARTTQANIMERLFIAPFWVHFHAEHHMFMHLPCWSLERAHHLMAAKGYGARMVIDPGYGAVLRRAASKLG